MKNLLISLGLITAPEIPVPTPSQMAYAVTHSSVDTINTLIDQGGDVNAARPDGWTGGVYGGWFGGKDSDSLLMYALTRISPVTAAIVQTLIDRNADVTYANKYGDTALHRAASRPVVYETEDTNIVTLLIAHKAHINFSNSKGYTPLHAAALAYNEKTCKTLLDHSADINAVDNQNETALHMATAGSSSHCSYRTLLSIANLLIERGIDRSIPNKSGKTALQCVRKRNENDKKRAIQCAQKDLEQRLKAIEKENETKEQAVAHWAPDEELMVKPARDE